MCVYIYIFFLFVCVYIYIYVCMYRERHIYIYIHISLRDEELAGINEAIEILTSDAAREPCCYCYVLICQYCI